VLTSQWWTHKFKDLSDRHAHRLLTRFLETQNLQTPATNWMSCVVDHSLKPPTWEDLKSALDSQMLSRFATALNDAVEARLHFNFSCFVKFELDGICDSELDNYLKWVRTYHNELKKQHMTASQWTLVKNASCLFSFLQ
jgi:hypothetical protein